ncbi:hypothetical protein [Nocardioides sp. SYSU DS0663]|uniref:hypothetical protein n=1 Tax=Nocardioides sp. SYSU DS0663 TaxID=3416445 RepID=UPI003F4BF547
MRAPTALHLGSLHGAEGFLVLVLALGPLLVAVLTVVYLRWRGEDGAEGDGSSSGLHEGG